MFLRLKVEPGLNEVVPSLHPAGERFYGVLRLFLQGIRFGFGRVVHGYVVGIFFLRFLIYIFWSQFLKNRQQSGLGYNVLALCFAIVYLKSLGKGTYREKLSIRLLCNKKEDDILLFR